MVALGNGNELELVGCEGKGAALLLSDFKGIYLAVKFYIFIT